ncbi:MAG: LEA type 2 family protein [Chitinophagales bacterium]|nr:LEA type 2 family protein [Chitinophagales bacterium]
MKNTSTFARMFKGGTGILIVALLGLGLIMLNRNPLQLQAQSGFALHRISASGYELQSTITIYNPNILSSTIENLHEEFRLNGELVSIIKQQPMQGIPGRKETSFPVSIRFDEEAFARIVAADSLFDGNTLNLNVTGEITYHNFTGGGSIVVDFDETVPLN